MILIHIIFGIFCSTLLFITMRILTHKNIALYFWQWILIIIELLYILFVLELIAGFIEEGSGKAAVVMGSIFGLLAIIGAVLIWRFIIKVKV